MSLMEENWSRQDVAPALRVCEPKSARLVIQKTVYGIDQQGGKGMCGYSEDVMPTLASDSHGTPHAVCYGISPYSSNCMLSDNPNSGIYVAETSRTLDLNGGNPACNQGGVVIVERE